MAVIANKCVHYPILLASALAEKLELLQLRKSTSSSAFTYSQYEAVVQASMLGGVATERCRHLWEHNTCSCVGNEAVKLDTPSAHHVCRGLCLCRRSWWWRRWHSNNRCHMSRWRSSPASCSSSFESVSFNDSLMAVAASATTDSRSLWLLKKALLWFIVSIWRQL